MYYDGQGKSAILSMKGSYPQIVQIFTDLLKRVHRNVQTPFFHLRKSAKSADKLFPFQCLREFSPSSMSRQKPGFSASELSSSTIGSFERKRKSRMVFLCNTR